jgi:hypothetical protein
MQKKNPLIAGLLNMLIPGSGHYYVGRDLKGFITTFFVGVILLYLAVSLGNAIENVKHYAITPGICPAGTLLVILVPLFMQGMKLAQTRNAGIDSAAFYNQSRQSMKGTKQSKQDQIQHMRDEGLISEQEYDQKQDTVDGDKKPK